MLTLEEYKKIYPQVIILTIGKSYPDIRIIFEGMLLFDDETACCWGGPYKGNYAYFNISDFSNAKEVIGPNKGRLLLQVWNENSQKAKSKIERGYNDYHKEKLIITNDHPTSEKPIRFYMSGNDDTSWSKFFASKKEALEELNLFIDNEPLNYHEIVQDFDFVFTN